MGKWSIYKEIEQVFVKEDIMAIDTKSNTSRISSGITLNADFYLRKYYRDNRDVIKSSARSDFKKSELTYEDSRALRRAASLLKNVDYENEKDMENSLYGSVMAYVKTYNNAITSGSGVDNREVERSLDKIKKLASKYSDELKKIGITTNKDGTLSASENLVKKADVKKVEKLFSSKSDFAKGIEKASKKLHNATYNYLYSEMTGNGLKINIQL